MRHFRVLAALLAITMGLGVVSGSPDSTIRPKNDPAPATSMAPGTFDVEQLGKALENLGYAVEPINNKDGNVSAYKVTFEANGWNYSIIVEISPSGEFIWLTAPLGQVNPGTVTSEFLMKLLSANAQIEPALFCIDERSHMLLIQMPINNKNVTQASLRQWFNYFCKSIRESKDVWKQSPDKPKTAAEFPSE